MASDSPSVIFCSKCGTKFPTEAPKEIYYSPSYKEVFEPTSPCPGDVVKYVQAEEAEFLKRQAEAQEGTIKKLREETLKYSQELKTAQEHTAYWKALYYSVSERTNWFSAADVHRQFGSQRTGGI